MMRRLVHWFVAWFAMALVGAALLLAGCAATTTQGGAAMPPSPPGAVVSTIRRVLRSACAVFTAADRVIPDTPAASGGEAATTADDAGTALGP